eukprot:CAMPEP_0204540984 /NCGR_PEP_ID=MMETSP0661-20131031/17893_1 /ASSEMBLY_ACC=CAM_ASM_000606 /TAXON_ID=109239 /ORGANISM="Alexandrium margalefi, Strain AMGDE01CS-322" /LENGTH=212 /DNA_ID=CAMNT_0051547653 /DNA_START=8 /DNA_END=642 /DNA_ORIENTATION=-
MVEAAFKAKTTGEPSLNKTLYQRYRNVIQMLEEMNAGFDVPAYQERAFTCASRRELTEHVRKVQYAVLPKFGMEAAEKGTVIMTAFINSVQRLPDVQYLVDRSMELSCVKLMQQLPAVVEKPKPVAEPLQVTCHAMPAEDGTESYDCLPVEATVATPIWELRDKLATALKWDEETARAVKFLAKQGNSFVGLKDSDVVRKVVYLRNSPPLQA